MPDVAILPPDPNGAIVDFLEYTYSSRFYLEDGSYVLGTYYRVPPDAPMVAGDNVWGSAVWNDQPEKYVGPGDTLLDYIPH